MNYGKTAAKGLKPNTATGQSVKWHCNEQADNLVYINSYCASLAKNMGYTDISIRCGVHNTSSRRDKDGSKFIERNVPWHFTVEFTTPEGKFRTGHIHVEVQFLDAEKRRPKALRLSPRGGRVTANPEYFDSDRSYKKNFITHNGSVAFSHTNAIFDMTSRFTRQARTKAPNVTQRFSRLY